MDITFYVIYYLKTGNLKQINGINYKDINKNVVNYSIKTVLM